MSYTKGPWSWWTSNSVRRLTAEGGPDGGVLYAYPIPGSADVCVSEDDMALIQAAPDLYEALRLVSELDIDLPAEVASSMLSALRRAATGEA